jgi:hypothetical protein
MDDTGEVLLGGEAIAAEISRLTGKAISPDQAYRWAKSGRIQAKKVGRLSSRPGRQSAPVFNRTTGDKSRPGGAPGPAVV